jgi:hypothetical protein
MQPEQSRPFARALIAATGRADPNGTDDIARSIVLGLANLETAGSIFRTPNYQDDYNRRPLEVLQALSTASESIYQQLHALRDQVSLLLMETVTPTLSDASPGSLLQEAKTGSHPLSPELRSCERQLRLLRWICSTRNKAVQHRAQHGYTGNNSIVLTDGFVLLRNPKPPTEAVGRKVKSVKVV